MKKLIIILSIVFIYSHAISQEDNYINFIQKNGEVIRINAEELKTITFENYSNTGFIHLNLIDSAIVFTISSINKMEILIGVDKIDTLSIMRNYSNDPWWGIHFDLTKLLIKDIKSISFSNYNELQNVIYSKIRIDLTNLQAVYNNSSSSEKFIKSYSIRNGTNIYGWNKVVYCTKYNLSKRIGNLHFSIDQSTRSSIGDYETCSGVICYLYIDTVNKFIDSLIIGLESKQFTIPSAGGSWRDENTTYEDFKLLALPYTKDTNKDIIVDFSITDLSQIKYSYYSKHLSGSSGGYDVGETIFKNFLPPTDSSKIIIRISP